MADWNAKQYLRFEKERTQPSIDLINRIGLSNPLNILDVGCGPGNSTSQLAAKYPDAKVIGMDNSPDMINRAKSDYPHLEFILGDVTDINLKPESYDIVFANAVIQWVPDHPVLLKNLFGLVRPGGVLACQMPMNHDEPSHRSIQALINSDKWKDHFDSFRVFYNLTPYEYYDLFSSLTDDFSLWLTTYYHTMKNHQDIVEWLKGTGLRPYLSKLSATDGEKFEHDLVEKYRDGYPVQRNGNVILRFPRFFFILRK